MPPALDPPMSPDELVALIRSIGLQADVLHIKILQIYGTVHYAVLSKHDGDALAGNLLRERSKLLNEKRGWQRDLNVLTRKGYF